MYSLNLVVLEEAAKKVTGRVSKSPLEEGTKHHNLFSVGCWDVLPFGRTPLKHGVIQESCS
jgi:hypothetical protein